MLGGAISCPPPPPLPPLNLVLCFYRSFLPPPISFTLCYGQIRQYTITSNRDEIALLEHELRRVKTENMSLLTALDKTERLVYKTSGVVNTTGATYPGKENAYLQVTQPNRYPWEKETDTAMRSTWHSSNHNNSNNSNNNIYSPNSELLSGYNKHHHHNHPPHQHAIDSTGNNTTRGRSPSLGGNRRLHRANAMATLATRGTVSSNARAMSLSSAQHTTLI